jgi:hypothetical protein
MSRRYSSLLPFLAVALASLPPGREIVIADPLERDYVGPDPKPRPPRSVTRKSHQGSREKNRRLRQAAHQAAKLSRSGE